MNIQDYISALQARCFNDELMGLNYENHELVVNALPGWLHQQKDREDNTNIGVDFCMSDTNGNCCEVHTVDFVVTFDLDKDVERFDQLVKEWVPILYPYF